MANSVDLVIGSEAIKQVENLISKLSLADAELIKISQSASGASKGISGISTPTGLDKAVTNTSALNAELEKQNAIIKALELEIKKLAYARQNNNKQTASEAVNQRILNQNAINEAKSVSNLVGAYQKLDLEHKKAIVNAQNLGVKYGETSTQFLKAAEKANILDNKLKTIDSALGKNQRNVGNYASGFNALGNSINQLSREAPAFANSINTGFMALSNNFPALFDAINGIRDKNKMLIEEGKPTVSVLKSIAGAVFSWQSLLSVGVTLLTIYGAKLIDYAFNTDEAKKSVEGLNRAYERNDDLMKIASNNIDHQITLQKELMRQQGKSQSEINDLDVKGAEMKLKNAERIRDIYQGQIEEVNKYKNAIKNGNEEAYFDELLKQVGRGRIAKEQTRIRVNSEDEVLAVIINNLNKAENEVKDAGFKLSELNSSNKTKEIEENKKLSENKTKINEDYLKDAFEANKKELELQLANIDIKLNNEDLYYSDRLIALDKDFLKRNEIAKLDYDEEFRLSKGSQDKQKTALLNFQLEKLKLIESYNKQKNTLEALDLDPITQLATSKSQDKDPFKSVIDSAAKATKSIKTNGETLKSDWKETFNAIADSAQQAGEIIAGFSEMNFKNEYARLEAQKDISLKFAGDSASAKQKIEDDYEKRRKEIANRENKAKQKQAIFNIAIDTAQAIMATVGKTGFAGLPLALILGALGAAQIAMVASQKIPEYWQGTDNASAGLAYTNERGAEIHTDKHGNIKDFGDNKGARLTMMAQGDKVYTAEETKRMMFNDDLNYMLNSRGVSMPINSQSNTMTAQQMDLILGKHFSKIQTNSTVIDKNGFAQWTEKRGNRTIQNANRVSRTGFKV